MDTVVGLFDNSDRARDAFERLRDSGIPTQDISVVARSADTQADVTRVETTDTGGDAASGAAAGAVGGGVLGGLAGLLVGVGALAIPGIGPIVAAGPIATTLAGAGIGAAAGGLVGALVGAGVPEEEARMYETGVQRGGILVAATVPTGMELAARDIMNAAGARDIRRDVSDHYNDPDFRYRDTTVI